MLAPQSARSSTALKQLIDVFRSEGLPLLGVKGHNVPLASFDVEQSLLHYAAANQCAPRHSFACLCPCSFAIPHPCVCTMNAAHPQDACLQSMHSTNVKRAWTGGRHVGTRSHAFELLQAKIH